MSEHTQSEPIEFRSIGYVKNEFGDCVPPDVSQAESSICLDSPLAAGLVGLEPGAEILVLFWFHESHGYDLLQHPKGDTSRPKRGVFALRSPHRPNAIGATRVRILDIADNTLVVLGLDALNGTPILDLKPVVV